MLKRAFDMLIALMLLSILWPVIVIVSIMIRVFIGSPILFRQQRPGLKGKPFNLYKFRSMSDECDTNGNILADEFRLKKFGKILRRLSLDELPQLINVVKGDMSLVGPRPLLMEYLPLYTSEQARRHEVRPGITGWAQVNGRNALSWEERFKLDVWYVDHQSWRLDLKILGMTIGKVVRSEGVSQKGQVTMSKFVGSVKRDAGE